MESKVLVPSYQIQGISLFNHPNTQMESMIDPDKVRDKHSVNNKLTNKNRLHDPTTPSAMVDQFNNTEMPMITTGERKRRIGHNSASNRLLRARNIPVNFLKFQVRTSRWCKFGVSLWEYITRRI